MSVNSAIVTALKDIAPTYANTYTGTATTYITFYYSTAGVIHADNNPQFDRYDVTVDYYCPTDFDCVATLDSIKAALRKAGFSWPAVTNVNDTEGQHWAFDCTYVEALT